jgi:hypothetical protein
MYNILVMVLGVGCVVGIRCHGGINMCELSVCHPNDQIGGLNGGLQGGYLSSELPPGKFPSCLSSGGW